MEQDDPSQAIAAGMWQNPVQDPDLMAGFLKFVLVFFYGFPICVSAVFLLSRYMYCKKD